MTGEFDFATRRAQRAAGELAQTDNHQQEHRAGRAKALADAIVVDADSRELKDVKLVSKGEEIDLSYKGRKLAIVCQRRRYFQH